jgi:hypothetical protein
LKEQEGWMAEAREFLRATLGMDVKTRAKSWGGLAPELWRYLLFSEFVFDLPVELARRHGLGTPNRHASCELAQQPELPHGHEACDGSKVGI